MSPILTFVRKFWVLIVLVLIIIAALAAYLLGFRVGSGLQVTRVGTLIFEQLPSDTTVYGDQTLLGSTAATSSLSFDMLAGSHSIIVSVPGDYPWDDLIPVASGKTTKISPILIPEHPNVTQLSSSTKTAAVADIASTTLPTEAHPLRLAGGCAAVYVSNNQVLAEAASAPGCTPPAYLCVTGTCAPTIIFSPIPELQAVFKYPGREDALAVAFNNTLYALALDPRNPQYFAPILGATNPEFGVLSNGAIVIDNSGTVYQVNL